MLFKAPTLLLSRSYPVCYVTADGYGMVRAWYGKCWEGGTGEWQDSGRIVQTKQTTSWKVKQDELERKLRTKGPKVHYLQPVL